MIINNFNVLVTAAQSADPVRVVIAGADNVAAMNAVHQAEEEGFAIPVLIGDEKAIYQHLQIFSDHTRATVISVENNPEIIARTAVSLITRHKADVLLKGSINTSVLLHAVLDKEAGIARAGLLSDSFLFEDSARTGNQLIAITDGGVVLTPDVDQKQIILENAVQVFHALGHRIPKVAVCAAIEKVNEKIPATVDAAELKRRSEAGEIDGCLVDGPLALDGALSEEALTIKGIASPLKGRADILVMPDINAANLVAKSTQYIGGREAAHVIMGAVVPVLIPSRSDTTRGKYLSIALAAVIQNYLTS